MSVSAANWRLTVLDICSGSGTADVTLKSGAVLCGAVDKDLSQHDVLFLRSMVGGIPTGGWHTIDWDEIAAISGIPSISR